jgi:hypothetical protein
VLLCLEEMEWGHQGEVAREVGEAWAGEDEDGDGWEEHEQEQDLAGIVSAPVVEQAFRIRWGLPATT